MVGTCDSGNVRYKTLIIKGFEQTIKTEYKNTLYFLNNIF